MTQVNDTGIIVGAANAAIQRQKESIHVLMELLRRHLYNENWAMAKVAATAVSNLCSSLHADSEYVRNVRTSGQQESSL